jgi:hypothetical protein
LRHNAKSDRSTAAAVIRNLDSLGRLTRAGRRLVDPTLQPANGAR